MSEKETIIKFIENWKVLRFENMYDLCQVTWKSNHSMSKLKLLLLDRPKSYKIVEVLKHNECMSDVNISLKIKGKIKNLTVRLIKEKEPFKTNKNGSWGVNPISLIKNLY